MHILKNKPYDTVCEKVNSSLSLISKDSDSYIWDNSFDLLLNDVMFKYV